MKEYAILVIVLLLVLIPSSLFRSILTSSGKELIQVAEELKEKIETEDEVEEAEASKLKEAFLEQEKIWILLVDHDMLDEIEYALEECVAFYHSDTKQDFLAAFNRFKDAVEDLPKREEISWINIL